MATPREHGPGPGPRDPGAPNPTGGSRRASGSGAARSVADDLRGRTDDELAALVRARPDLIRPVPADVTALATRVGSAASVASALRDLDQLCLTALLAASLGPDAQTRAGLIRTVSVRVRGPRPTAADRAEVAAVIDRLTTMALLWGSARALHVLGAARDLLVLADQGPRAGTVDPVVAGYAADPESLVELVDQAPPGVRAAVERLLTGSESGPAVGAVVDARRIPDPARSPVDWLLHAHLVLPVGSDRVVVPAEVGQILRRHRSGQPQAPIAVPELRAPAPAAIAPEPHRVAAGSVGALLDLLHAVSELGVTWGATPPTRVRSGGVAARDLTRTARDLAVSEPVAALVVEVAAAAGLLAPDAREAVTILPTTAFDAWAAAGPASRCAELLTAWWDMPRSVAGPGQRALDAVLADTRAPGLRREVVEALATPVGAWTADELIAALRWRAPRRIEAGRLDRARTVLVELGQLGLVVGGVLTRAGQALLADDRAGLEAALAEVLPAAVDSVIMQADLTAVVPGLPTPALAALLRVCAEPESTGAASVYRFTEASVRRALDAGRTAADLTSELGRRGQIPQPLTYLIDDVARRHAMLRIGVAATFLRCDDPVLLAAILADPGAADLGLFRLAESVLASDRPADEVLERLRELGHHPQPEPGRGVSAPGPRRARARVRTAPTTTGIVSPALAAAAVRAMRAADRPDPSPAASGRPTRSTPQPQPGTSGSAGTTGTTGETDGAPSITTATPTQISATLRGAIAEQSPVWIGYVEPSGVASSRHVEPLRVTGGYLTALELTTEAITSFALARITGVARA